MTKQLRSAQFVLDLTNVRAIMEQQLGADNINMIHVLRPLADHYVSAGQHEDSERVLRAILALCERSSSPVLPRLSEARMVLAETLCRLGKLNEALALCQPEATVELSMGTDSKFPATSMAVSCLKALDRLEEAEALVRSLVTMIDAAPQGTFSKATQSTWLARLSRVLAEGQKYAEAAEVSERAILFYELEVHTIPDLDTLAELYRKAGNSEAFQRTRARRRELAKKYDF